MLISYCQFEHNQLLFGTLQFHFQFHGFLAEFLESMIIIPTCSGVLSSNSINKAKTGTEVVSLRLGVLDESYGTGQSTTKLLHRASPRKENFLIDCA